MIMLMQCLQSSKNMIDCSELFGLAIQVSLSTFATLLIIVLFYYFNSSRCYLAFNNWKMPIKYFSVFVKWSVLFSFVFIVKQYTSIKLYRLFI